jgi:hypothetical protein
MLSPNQCPSQAYDNDRRKIIYGQVPAPEPGHTNLVKETTVADNWDEVKDGQCKLQSKPELGLESKLLASR